MKLKLYVHYQMDFKGSWIQPSAVLMGLSFFLRIVYYFGFTYLSQWTFSDTVFQIIFPLLICGAYVVLISALRWNAPGIYAILGAALCVLFIIWSFSSGSVLRIFLSILIYTAAGLILLGTAGGYLPGKRLSSALFLLPLICRIFLLELKAIGLSGLVLEVSVLSAIASMFCLTRCFKVSRHRSGIDLLVSEQ